MIETQFESLNIADTMLREHPEIKPGKGLFVKRLSDEEVVDYCGKLAELAVEKAQLGHLLYQETGQIRAERDKTKLPEKRFSYEEELKAIAEGKIDQIFKEEPEDLAFELNKRLQTVETEIRNLVGYSQVVERYRVEFAEKVRVIQAVREIEKLRNWIDNLEGTKQLLVLKRQEKGVSQADNEILSRNEGRVATARERIAFLGKDQTVLTEERRRELLRYRKQLQEEGFVETPSIKELLRSLASRVRLGKPILLWGHTGTGKTEISRHLSHKLFGEEPEIFSGSEEVTHYDLFGKTQLKPGGSYFQDGPAVKALRKGKPLLIDEVDLVPHSIIGRLQDLLTRRPGKTVTVQENGNETIIVPPGFIVLATGNLRSSKYRREELDPAFLRRFWQTEAKYLSLPETYDILLASLIDRRGKIDPRVRGSLERLCQAAKFVQDVFTGEKTDFMGEGADASRGIGASLGKATLSIGDLLNIVQQWKAENFSKPLEDYILSEFIQSQTVRQDQFNLVKIFCLHEFFQNKKAEELGIPGLTERKLTAYRAGST